MDRLVQVFAKAPQTRAQNDDDFADRLSSRYTVIQLIAFAILVGLTQVSLSYWLDWPRSVSSIINQANASSADNIRNLGRASSSQENPL